MEILTFTLMTHAKINEFWDGLTYTFHFKCLPKEKVGEPDEGSATTIYHVVVRISGTLSALWQLGNVDLIKVLYMYSQQALKENPYKNNQTMELHSGNTSSKCQYNPKDIKFPEPIPFDVEITRKIGF